MQDRRSKDWSRIEAYVDLAPDDDLEPSIQHRLTALGHRGLTHPAELKGEEIALICRAVLFFVEDDA